MAIFELILKYRSPRQVVQVKRPRIMGNLLNPPGGGHFANFEGGGFTPIWDLWGWFSLSYLSSVGAFAFPCSLNICPWAA